MKSSMLLGAMALLVLGLVDGQAECGTHNPTEKQMKHLKRALAKPYVATKRNAATTTRQGNIARCIQCHEVQVIVHVVDTEAGDSMAHDLLEDGVLENELLILNQAYAKSAFKFVLKRINHIVNDELSLGNAVLETDIWSALIQHRVGGPDVCNIFYTDGTCGTVRGFSVFPSDFSYQMYPVDEYEAAHCVFMCANQTTTEESLEEEESFTTILIHEVGHWMGVFHPFHGLDCDGDGDLVDDTPAQGSQYRPLPLPDGLEDCRSQDTCPSQPGLDPINNFMNYTPYKCQAQFTAGQFERMYIQFDEYYRKLEPCGSTPTIEAEFLFDEHPNENGIAFWEWGESEETADIYDLKYYDSTEGHEYANKEARFKNCFDPKSLYMFYVEDTGGNGIQDPGYFKLTANGRELFQKSTFAGAASYVFFSLDASTCPMDHIRFGLDLSFDAFPEETSWELTSHYSGEVVCDYTTSLAFGETHYEHSAFRLSTLYVDCCVLADSLYTFTIHDSPGSGMLSSGGYRLFVDGVQVSSFTGDDSDTWESKSEVVVVGNLPATQPPSTTVPSQAPSDTTAPSNASSSSPSSPSSPPSPPSPPSPSPLPLASSSSGHSPAVIWLELILVVMSFLATR